jgi:hypothetical protein
MSMADTFAVFVGIALLFVGRTKMFKALAGFFFPDDRAEQDPVEEPVEAPVEEPVEEPVEDKGPDEPPKETSARDELPQEEVRPETPAVEDHVQEETIEDPPRLEGPARLGLFANSMPSFYDMLDALTRKTGEEATSQKTQETQVAPTAQEPPIREEANCSPFLFIET